MSPFTSSLLQETKAALELSYILNWVNLIFLSSFYVFRKQFYQHNDIFTEVFPLIIALMLIKRNIIVEIIFQAKFILTLLSPDVKTQAEISFSSY